MPSSYIFDIQRSSFVDGPGIRTVVFFKGCNLRCVWCHNPESWQLKPQILYYEKRCIQCNRCVEVCPTGALDKSYYPDPELCTACGKCVTVCPADARQLCGKEQSPEDVFEIIKKDKIFYDTSGGGVTFSGGECMLHVDYLLKITRLCKREGISVAIDTAGNVPYSHFEQIKSNIDLILFDIKCLDPVLHEKITGVRNDLILSNYKRLYKEVPDKLIVRIPIIPGYNLTDKEMERIVAFLDEYPPSQIELLPYHRLGENKRSALQMPNIPIDVPSEDVMNSLRKLFHIS